jgi:SpoVK/Ycf46/Vps4 family AAA+-type ATPase
MQEVLTDQTITFAKNRSDAKCTPLHILYVIVKRFADEFEDFQNPVQSVLTALGPEGDSIVKPTISEEAQKILDTFSSKQVAIDWAMEQFPLLTKKSGQSSAPVQQKNAPEKETEASEKKTQSDAVVRSTDEIFASLDAMIGLSDVKIAVRQIVARQKAAEVMQSRGIETVFSKHLVFTGAPGTGKTTVARFVAELYASMNILPHFSFVEASRADLVGGYVGQTALKVKEVIDKARGGVLFIDEAYALMPRHDSDYGHEAIATLVQYMENYRNELVIILAGYADEMQALIDVNPGLRSRMTTFIDFPNYTPQELIAIFRSTLLANKMSITDAAMQHVEDQLQIVATRSDFGNGRFVRSLWETSFTQLALRDFADGAFDDSELRVLDVADVDNAFKQLMRSLPAAAEPRRGIGFLRN